MVIFWFRRDLRLNDNAGLYYALKENSEVQPLFIFDTVILGDLKNRSDRRVDFIHQALRHLKNQLRSLNSDILVLKGNPVEVLKKLAEEYPLKAVYTNHDYEPYAIERDNKVAQLLKSRGIVFKTFKDQCIFEKEEIIKDDGQPYTVFTPYSKKWKEKCTPFYYKPYPVSKYFDSLKKSEEVLYFPSMEEIGFHRTDINFSPPSDPDPEVLRMYKERRDFPGKNGTTRLSVHLRFGTVSIRHLVALAIRQKAETWLNELIWREFFMMLLYFFPHTVHSCFRKEFDNLPWENDLEKFEKWKTGNTGIPIVDAGMRELLHTGYMHNRVRMITASFLVKNLLIDWRWGEAWFAQNLNDFDLSANVGNWQWAASTGCDAAPYFRIFNPIEQQKKFDPDYLYIEKWVPEWNTASYPKPIVDLKTSREKAIKIYQATSKLSRGF